MARTTTASEAAILTKRNQAVYLRVYVDEDGLGNFVDLATLIGRDWVVSARWGENVDSPVSTAQIGLIRESYDNSLSPLMTASRFNQPAKKLEVSREIRVYTATRTHGEDFVEDLNEYELVFQGVIDEIDFGGSQSNISLNCRDLGAVLQDTFIEVQRETGPDDLPAVIQQILTDNGLGSITLFTPVAPTFTINKYLQRKEPVFDAIRKLAQMIGWDIRYRWDNGTASFRLTLFEPDRSKTVPDFTLGADRYDDLTKLKVSRTRIRNVVEVTYGPNEQQRTTVQLSDASSISRYGRRFMELTEASSSEIDTVTEATAMAQAALDDLKEPDAEASAQLDYFFPVQTGDLIRFTANGTHFDVDQDLAVVSYGHQIDNRGAKTSMVLRGKPSSGINRWLAIEGRAGVSPNNDFEAPEEPTILNLSGEKGALVIEYRKPTNPDWDLTKVYVLGPVENIRIRNVERTSNVSTVTLREEHGLYRQVNLSTLARLNNIATVVTSTAHGLNVGAVVNINAIDNTYDDATAEVLQVIDATSFTYINAGADSVAAADAGAIAITESGVLVTVDAEDNTYDAVGAAITIVDEYSFTYTNAGADSGSAADQGIVSFVDFDAGGQNFVAQTRSDRIEIFGLIPGRRYLIKLVAIDIRGNETSIGTVLENATLFSSPIHLNPEYDKDNMVYNGDFSVWTPPYRTRETTAPDIWVPFLSNLGGGATIDVEPTFWGDGGAGSGEFVYFDESVVNSTETSIRVRAAKNPADIADIVDTNGVWGLLNDREFLPIGGEKVYRMAFSFQNSLSTNFGGFFVQFYDANKALVGNAGIVFANTVAGQWLFGQNTFLSASTARFMQYEVAKFYTAGESSSGSEEYTYFDRAELLNARPGSHRSVFVDILPNRLLPTGVATTIDYNASIQNDGMGLSGFGVVVSEEGAYTIHAQIALTVNGGGNIPAGTDLSLEVYVNGSPTYIGERIFLPTAVTGRVVTVTIAHASLDQDDVVDIRFFHNAGLTLQYLYSEPERNYFTIFKHT